jgi:hypothetical protein
MTINLSTVRSNRLRLTRFVLLGALCFGINSATANVFDDVKTSLYQSFNHEPQTEHCSIANEAWQVGEKLTYKVYYNLNFVWVPAGEVVFAVTESNNTYRLSATGRTYKSYEWFFKVRDTYEAYVDKNTLQPVMSIRDIKEGSFSLFHRQTFDFGKKQVQVESGDTRAKTVKEKFNFQGCVHDIVSLIYYARNLNPDNYKKGDRVPIKVFMDKQTYAINVHFKGKEAKKDIKESGVYKTYKFSPEMATGSTFGEGEKMIVYCSDDKNRVPVLIESPLSVGSVKVILAKTEGLRNAASAKLQ